MPRSDATLKIDADVRGATKAINKLNKDLSAVKLNAFVNLGKEAMQVGSSMVQTSASFNSLQIALDSVSGSSVKGAQSFEQLLKLSENTQFTVSDLSREFIKLKAAGIEPTNELMMTFADTAAITTDGLGTMTAMADMLARTTAGGLGLEHVNRLADRGVPVFRILEEQLGLTRLEITEFGKSAEGAKKITDTLFKTLGKEFGGNAAKQANHVSVAFQNLGVSADLMVTSWMEESGLFGVLKAVAEIAGVLADALTIASDETDKLAGSTKNATDKTKEQLTTEEKINKLLLFKKSLMQDLTIGDELWKQATQNQIDMVDTQIASLQQYGDQHAIIRQEIEKNKAAFAESEKRAAGPDPAKVKALEEEVERRKEAYDTINSFTDNSLKMELSLEEAGYNQKLNMLKQYNQSKLISDKQYETAKTALQKQEVQNTIATMGSALTELGKHNKTAFKAAKAFNIAQAVMNTYTGATKALATYPPPWSFIMAGAQIAMGFAQVAQIRSQQYQGRQFGGTTTGNTPYLVGERGPEIFTPGRTGTITPNAQSGGKPVNVTFNINATDASGFDQLLQTRKPMIIGMVRQAVHEQPALLQG